MSTPAAPPTRTSKGTSERRVARLFGLSGDGWQRHANPLSVWTRFAAPRSTRNWASRSVFGEHIWSDRDTVELPARFRTSRVPAVATAVQVAGVALLAYGLLGLDLLSVVAGLVLGQTAKAWHLDRMVLLFEDMKGRNPEYAGWEH
jgi:hypothetical protein